MIRGSNPQQMYRYPGSVPRRVLVAALEERGWEMVRRAQGHDVYAKAGWPEIVSLPARLRGTGTVRRIVQQLQVEEASHE